MSVSIIDATGLTREQLDTRVQELAADHLFNTAALMIEDWVEWDWHGRWNEPALEPAPFNPLKPRGKNKNTVGSRLSDEFGTLGP